MGAQYMHPSHTQCAHDVFYVKESLYLLRKGWEGVGLDHAV